MPKNLRQRHSSTQALSFHIQSRSEYTCSADACTSTGQSADVYWFAKSHHHIEYMSLHSAHHITQQTQDRCPNMLPSIQRRKNTTISRAQTSQPINNDHTIHLPTLVRQQHKVLFATYSPPPSSSRVCCHSRRTFTQASASAPPLPYMHALHDLLPQPTTAQRQREAATRQQLLQDWAQQIEEKRAAKARQV